MRRTLAIWVLHVICSYQITRCFSLVIVATDDIGIEHIEEFLAEAAFMKHYNHVNILKPLGVVWSDGDRPQVILPYMAKGDLCSLIRKPEVVSMTNKMNNVWHVT